MNGTSFVRPDQVVAVAEALEADGIPYAIGGALALGYAAEPRSTFDIDVNVFVDVSRIGDVLRCLAERLVFQFDVARARHEAERDFQVRIDWNGTFIDLFFAFSAFHEGVALRAHVYPFPGKDLPVLSPEDLVCFKVMFNRPKDWVDIEKLLYFRHTDFDREYVRQALSDALGADDSALIRLQELMTSVHKLASEKDQMHLPHGSGTSE